MKGRVLDSSVPFWLIRYEDGDWEECDEAEPEELSQTCRESLIV